MSVLSRPAAAAALIALSCATAGAQTIGIVAPLSDANAILGAQIRDGATAAAEAGGAAAVVADDYCTAVGGDGAARRMVAAGVDVVVGFLCTEAIEAALPVLTAAGIPVITPGVRTDSLTDQRERTGNLIWRMAPRADDERAAVSDLLLPRWRDELFAIVDDGTIYGRELAESLRFAAENAGLEPVFFDTFRPQLENQIGLVGRLDRAGATHVFAGGDREDVAIMARDAAQLDYGLTFAGGEALRAPSETPMLAGTLMVALPEWVDVADPAVADALREAGSEPDGYTLPAYAAVEVALAALRRAADAGGIAAALRDGSFDTAVGTIAFDANGDLAGNPYRLFSHDGERFVPVEN